MHLAGMYYFAGTNHVACPAPCEAVVPPTCASTANDSATTGLPETAPTVAATANELAAFMYAVRGGACTGSSSASHI